MSDTPVRSPLYDRLAGGLFGLLLLWGASLSAMMAQAHASALGRICGATSPHCAWRHVAVGMSLAGITLCLAAMPPVPSRVKSAARCAAR